MCGTASTLVYSPRRLVALAAMGAGSDSSVDPEPPSDPASHQPAPSGRPDPSAFVRNLKVPMPLGRKLKIVVRNTAIKIKTRRNCCGHPGEPGC